MRIPRFFLSRDDLERLSAYRNNQTDNLVSILEPELVHRIRSVLRHRPGDRVRLMDNCGYMYECVLVHIEKRSVLVRIEQRELVDNELLVAVTVAQSVVKGDRFDWCLEKLTELGVSTIVPLICERGVVRPLQGRNADDRSDGKMMRWQSLVREAAEQCERARAPQVVVPVDSATYFSQSQDHVYEYRYICVERSSAISLMSALQQNLPTVVSTFDTTEKLSDRESTSSIKISVAIGPEGGLTANEISIAENYGWQPVSLGARILRSETAGIVAMAQIASVLDR